MNCSSCWNEIGDAKFCPECGTKVEPVKEVTVAGGGTEEVSAQKYCLDCNIEVGKVKFCPDCGEEIESILEEAEY